MLVERSEGEKERSEAAKLLSGLKEEIRRQNPELADKELRLNQLNLELATRALELKTFAAQDEARQCQVWWTTGF